MKIIVFGEIIWDICGNNRTIGGAPFNFAANLGYLGDTAYLVTAVGRDDLGKEALRCMDKYSAGRDLVQINGYDTGRCTVTLDENRIPCYQVATDAAYDHITFDGTLSEKVKAIDPDALYFGTLSQRGASREALKKLIEAYSFREIFCDINIREGCCDAESTRRCLETATILKISEEEAHYLFEYKLVSEGEKDLEKQLAETYPNLKQILFTMGKKGSRVYDASERRYYESGIPRETKVVSTVGAGDCYGATYFHYYMSGASVQEAIDEATKQSSMVVASSSAFPF